MKLSRRALLKAGIGLSQLALLERFGLTEARAAPTTTGPTKLLCVWIQGGLHHDFMWTGLSSAGVTRYLTPPDSTGAKPLYGPDMVENLDGSGQADADATIRRLRGPITWNWAEPKDNTITGTRNPKSPSNAYYCPNGYAWASPDYKLYEQTVLLHGLDQGTAAHQSGVVAGLCGVAGASFRAPALPAVVANAFSKRFPDRPLANVSIRGFLSPSGLDLPSAANPIFIGNTADLAGTLSDKPDLAWQGLRSRQQIDDLAFDGSSTGQQLPATALEAAVLRATRAQRGRSSAATDTLLQGLHDTYRGYSRTLARNVVDLLQATPGIEHLPAAMPWAPGESRLGWRVGYADAVASDSTWSDDFDIVLRLLKSDLASAITFKCMGLNNFSFDTHFANPYQAHSDQLRGMFESLGRLLIEMKLTPSRSQPGQTLLDETMVYIFSDFGRTFPLTGGSDHHPASTVALVNGTLQGNRMIGGYDETAPGSPMGIPVQVTEETGASGSRAPRAADGVATALRAMGLELGKDFFIPGGYAEIVGARRA